jgi:hypothetical protein
VGDNDVMAMTTRCRTVLARNTLVKVTDQVKQEAHQFDSILK